MRTVGHRSNLAYVHSADVKQRKGAPISLHMRFQAHMVKQALLAHFSEGGAGFAAVPSSQDTSRSSPVAVSNTSPYIAAPGRKMWMLSPQSAFMSH